MKQKLLFLSAATLLIASCCTKKACDDLDAVLVQFAGFQSSDIDTIYTTGYILGSNFAQVARPEQMDTAVHYEDTLYRLASVTNGYYDGGYLSDKYDWVVYIPSVNKTVRINNYGYNTFKCNRCFPYSPPSNKTRSLSTCSVNGQTVNARDVVITK